MSYHRYSSYREAREKRRLRLLTAERRKVGLPPVGGWHMRKEPFALTIARFSPYPRME